MLLLCCSLSNTRWLGVCLVCWDCLEVPPNYFRGASVLPVRWSADSCCGQTAVSVEDNHMLQRNKNAATVWGRRPPVPFGPFGTDARYGRGVRPTFSEDGCSFAQLYSHHPKKSFSGNLKCNPMNHPMGLDQVRNEYYCKVLQLLV